MFFKPSKDKVKKNMAKIKQDELWRAEIMEEYLRERIEAGEKERRNQLMDVQRLIQEAQNQIEFYTRQ